MSGNKHYTVMDVHKDTVTLAVADKRRSGRKAICGQCVEPRQ
jgi:hypothetical protein